MKFTCDRKPFAAVLAAAVRIIEKRSTIPILSNLLLVAEAGQVFVTADNLNMRVIAPVPAEVLAEGAATLPGAILNDVVRGLPAQARISLEAPEKERATLRSGRSRSTLATLPAQDFPDGAHAQYPHKFAIDGKDLARAMERCLISASTEETRYYLNGVYIHAHEPPGDEPTLRFVATDGHRLVLTAEPLPDGAAGLPGIILPRLAAVEVQKLASGGGMVSIEASASRIGFGFAGGLQLLTKTIDGTFPDYGRVMPVGNSKIVGVDRAGLIAALDRVSSVRSAEERRGGVKFAVAEGRLVLSARTDLNEAVEELDVTSAASIETGFNPAYARALLGCFESETVEFALEDPGSPAQITVPGDVATTCVLMPMRV